MRFLPTQARRRPASLHTPSPARPAIRACAAPLAAAVMLTLSACGGGSSGSDSSANAQTSTASFPVEAVLGRLATEPSSFEGRAQDGVTPLTLTVRRTPLVDTTFEGERVQQVEETLSVKAMGLPFKTVSQVELFTTGPYWPKGVLRPSGKPGTQKTAPAPLPATAHIGDSGPLGTMNLYDSRAMDNLSGHQTTTWYLEADTVTTAFLCSRVQEKDTRKNEEATLDRCYRIDTAGTVLGIRWTAAYGGKMLTFE